MDFRKISRQTALLAAVLFVPGHAHPAGGTDTPAPLTQILPAAEAQYRGCDARGWCLFEIESRESIARTPVRVRPDGVARVAAGDPVAVQADRFAQPAAAR